jgi:hypothetical protein
MVLKGGVLENKRRRRRGIMVFFFGKRIGRAKSTCDRKPQTLF